MNQGEHTRLNSPLLMSHFAPTTREISPTKASSSSRKTGLSIFPMMGALREPDADVRVRCRHRFSNVGLSSTLSWRTNIVPTGASAPLSIDTNVALDKYRTFTFQPSGLWHAACFRGEWRGHPCPCATSGSSLNDRASVPDAGSRSEPIPSRARNEAVLQATERKRSSNGKRISAWAVAVRRCCGAYERFRRGDACGNAYQECDVGKKNFRGSRGVKHAPFASFQDMRTRRTAKARHPRARQRGIDAWSSRRRLAEARSLMPPATSSGGSALASIGNVARLTVFAR